MSRIDFNLPLVNVNVSLRSGVSGIHRIVFDDETEYKHQIPLTTEDIDTMILKLQEMKANIR